jgi:uncharacterized membrane protein
MIPEAHLAIRCILLTLWITVELGLVAEKDADPVPNILVEGVERRVEGTAACG